MAACCTMLRHSLFCCAAHTGLPIPSALTHVRRPAAPGRTSLLLCPGQIEESKSGMRARLRQIGGRQAVLRYKGALQEVLTYEGVVQVLRETQARAYERLQFSAELLDRLVELVEQRREFAHVKLGDDAALYNEQHATQHATAARANRRLGDDAVNSAHRRYGAGTGDHRL